MSDFHLLRPEWLLALLPLFISIFFQRRQKALSGQWKNIIAPQLQKFVLKQPPSSTGRFGIINSGLLKNGLWLAAALAIFALTGPSWQKQPSQVYSSQGGLVIALDLSLSMTSQDLSPSRLQRAKFKITDILKQAGNENVALIAYAGDAHVASPLTQDAKTILNMLPALDPYIMPVAGSNLRLMVEEAVSLFHQGKSKPRTLLLVTDGVEPQDIEEASKLLKQADIQLAILAVGTHQGAPIVKPDGSFFKDNSGQVIMPTLEWDNLQKLASANQARITKISNTDADIQYLITQNSLNQSFEEQEKTVEFDQWLDSGYWLLLPILLLSLTLFRRGILLVAVISIITAPKQTWAESTLPDLLLNNDQIALKQFTSNPKLAADTFDDQKWKASSLYKAKDYQGALDIWQQYDDPQSLYNSANALAQLQRLEDAIKRYEEALLKSPNHDDAKVNKALLEAMKKQHDEQKQDGGKGDQDKQDGEQGDQKDSDQSQDGQQSEQEGENKEQQESQQASQDESGENGESSQSDNPAKDGEQQEAQNPLAKEQTEEEKKKQQQAQALKEKEGKDQPQGEEQVAQSQQAISKSTEEIEKEQAMQQWIERIPDDPGGLLRNKFLYQYKNKSKNRNNNQNGDRKPW